MAISLKIVLSGFVTLTVIITALVAFLPLYLSGLDSVESAVDNIRRGIIDRSENNVQAFFKRGSDTAIAVSRSTYHGITNFEVEFANNRSVLATYLYNLMADGQGTVTTASVKSTTPWQMFVDARGAAGFPSNHFSILMQPNTTLFDVGIYYSLNNSNTQIYFNRTLASFNFPFPNDPFTNEERTVMDSRRTQWQSASFSFDDVSVNVAAPVYVNKGVTGIFGISLLPRDINRFLQGIGLRKGGRAMVYEAVGEGTLIANSWGQPNAVVTGQDFSGNNLGILVPLTNLTDALINEVIAEYTVARLVNGTVPISETMGTKEKDRTYVDVIGVTDEYGLNLRVLVAMPLIDFLEDFYDSRSIVIGILVSAVVVLVAIAVLFAILLAKPLDRLGERMYMTASLQDSGEDDAPSALSEVAEMQAAYVAMKNELLRMKSYLPESVLQGLYGDDDDEGDVQSSVQEGSNNGSSVNAPASDSASKLSRSSRASSAQKYSDTASSRMVAVTGRGGLNLAGSTSQKRVTVLAINAVNYIGRATGSAAAMGSLQSRLTSKVVAVIRDQKGVLDFFQGDHFVATFNAVNNIGAQQKRAAVTAMGVRDALETEGLQAKMGMASSMATVGNMGSDDVKRFNVIGRCYGQAANLMRIAKRHPKIHTLVHQNMCEEVGLEMYLQLADAVLGHDEDTLHVAASLEGPKTMATDEWMYQLEDVESKDPFAAANKAVEHALQDDDASAAQQQLSKLEGTPAAELRAAVFAREVLAAGGGMEYAHRNQ